MTVKILSVQPTRQITCKFCGVRHEFTNLDTKEDSELGRYINCLHCERCIVVKVD